MCNLTNCVCTSILQVKNATWIPKVVFHTHIALTLQGKVTQGGGQDRGGTVFLTTRAKKPSTSECLHYLLYTKKKIFKGRQETKLISPVPGEEGKP